MSCLCVISQELETTEHTERDVLKRQDLEEKEADEPKAKRIKTEELVYFQEKIEELQVRLQTIAYRYTSPYPKLTYYNHSDVYHTCRLCVRVYVLRIIHTVI